MRPGPDAEERLSTLMEGWAEVGDRRGAFAQCYLVMTKRVHDAVDDGVFTDGAWVTRLLERFADYYFDAIDAHGTPVPEHPCPEVWRSAFDACADPSCHVLQVLMLGINAHINHDLALALVDVLDDWDTLDEATRSARHEDHERVNEIIEATTDEVQREVVDRWSPAAHTLDVLLWRLDEWAFGALAESWRSRVWADAMELLALPPESRGEASIHLGTRASTVASVILLGRHPRHGAEDSHSEVAHAAMPEPAADGIRISLPE
jgi:hypothetical protein